MHEDLQTPLAVYSKGFKSPAPTSDMNYFMTLEEYLDKYYKPRTYLSYDEWINKQCDNDGDGKVGASSSKLSVRNAEKRQKKKLLQDPTTYSKWEAYVQTIVAANDEESRRLKAQWETSRYYELATQDAGTDSYRSNSSGTDITTRYDKDAELAKQDTTQQRTMIIVLAVAAMIFIYLLIKSTKNKKN